MPDALFALEQQARQHIRLKQHEQARAAFLSLLKQDYAGWSLSAYILAINTCLRCMDRIHAAQLLQQGLQQYPDSMQLCLIKARELLTDKKKKANAVPLFVRVLLTEPDLLGVQDLIRCRELMYLASLREDMAEHVQAQFFIKLQQSKYSEFDQQALTFEFHIASQQLKLAKTLFDAALLPHLAQLKKKHALGYIRLLKALAEQDRLTQAIQQLAHLFNEDEQQLLLDDIRLLSQTSWVLLADKPGYRMEYYRQRQASNYLFVCFNGVMGHKKHRTFGLDFMLRQGFDVITVNSAMQGNYQLLSVQDFEALVRPVSQQYRHVYTYGHSLGAYMALYFAGTIDAQVIASAPRHPGHPRFYQRFDPALQQALTVPYQHRELVDVTKTSQPVFIFYDPFEQKDQFMLDELVQPAYPQAKVYQLPRATHSTVMVLKELGLLKEFILSIVYRQQFLPVDLSSMQPTEKMLLAMLREVADQQEHADMIRIADQLLAVKPQHAEAFYHKVEALLGLKQEIQARELLQQALAVVPASSQSYYNQLCLLRDSLLPAAALSEDVR